jgi:hypothetical protein
VSAGRGTEGERDTGDSRGARSKLRTVGGTGRACMASSREGESERRERARERSGREAFKLLLSGNSNFNSCFGCGGQ